MNGELLKAKVSTFVIKTRVEQGLSHTDLAKKSKLARSTIHNIENGNTSPTLENTIMLLTALGKDLTDLASYLKEEPNEASVQGANLQNSP